MGSEWSLWWFHGHVSGEHVVLALNLGMNDGEKPLMICFFVCHCRNMLRRILLGMLKGFFGHFQTHQRRNYNTLDLSWYDIWVCEHWVYLHNFKSIILNVIMMLSLIRSMPHFQTGPYGLNSNGYVLVLLLNQKHMLDQSQMLWPTGLSRPSLQHLIRPCNEPSLNRTHPALLAAPLQQGRAATLPFPQCGVQRGMPQSTAHQNAGKRRLPKQHKPAMQTKLQDKKPDYVGASLGKHIITALPEESAPLLRLFLG